MILLFSIFPEYSSEMLFFSAVSALGLFFLLIGWIASVIGEGGFEFFGDDFSDVEGLDFETSDVTTIVNSDDIDFSGFDGDIPMPSFFSLKVLRIVMLCFGLGGNTGLRIGLDFSNSLLMATIVGFLSGYLVYQAFKYIYKQTFHNFRDPIIVGREGRVILNIPSDGFGQIAVNIVGQRYVFRAKSLDNHPINAGINIKIRKKNKGTCFVETIE